MYGGPKTKELKEKHSFRLVGEAETGSWKERTHDKAVTGGPDEAVAGGLGRRNSCADKPGGTTGEQDRLSNPGFQCREVKLQSL